jgi:glycosyltransferase involved in cell wall biosynthesis
VVDTAAPIEEVSGNGARAYTRTPLRPKVTVVIPTLNEAENLPLVLPLIADVDEIIIVDGHSTDGTREVALAHPRIRVVEAFRPGKGAALQAGFAAATGDIIVTLDGDGSTDPAEIPAFVGTLRTGADFAKGSRFVQGAGTSDMPFYRRLGNAAFVLLVRILFGGRYSDLCYGYNAFWADVLPYLDLDGDGFEIETMMNIRALRSGLRIVEVASFERARFYGNGHLRTFSDGWRVLKTILSERFRRAAVRAGRVGESLPPAGDLPAELSAMAIAVRADANRSA